MKKGSGARRKRRQRASDSARWRKENPEKVKRDNARRRNRRDKRDCTLWHRRLRCLMLHCGEFHTRIRERDAGYKFVTVDLTVMELAQLWFRDTAWMMKRPECDRIDPEGHYEFKNCRFIERRQNQERKRNAAAIFLGDKTEPKAGREPGMDG